ncbi:MAG: NAD(+) diphosphatase [Synergistaceae bacterium]|jgi:NAD+ diphosphatase|nr:NAD(+) diphosphatase [Synergistaceae bacterium]
MLVFKGDNLLVGDEGPDGALRKGLSRVTRDSRNLPEVWQEAPAWCEVEDAPDDLEWADLRAVWARWGDEVFARAGTAYQYMNWLRSSRFCSACGAPLSPKRDERGLVCASCGRVTYAPLHPAIIVAVERDGKLLLARNTRMPQKRYSVLAGFVEPGESLEQAIAREVMEEVKIEIGEIRYFGSQPWPFPCSLMLGFTARWKGGELCPDGVELDDAGWFSPNEFPDIPPALSIARKLIDNFTRARRGQRFERKQEAVT